MRSLLLRTSCLAGLIAMSAPALAQDTAPAAAEQPADGAASEQSGLEDIVVTAQRRSENLQRAAVAVTALSGDDLVRANITSPTGLTNLVPALTVNNAAGPYALYYVRGVGNFNANPLSDSAVAVNLDGVFLARPSGTAGQFYDVERVEVLKGPQGTLYGRNATGGAVNIITKKPQLGKIGGEVSASYGNYEAVQANGAINLPLGETAAVRIAGQYARHDGYMTDGSSDQNDRSGRIQFLWEPKDNIKIQLGADYYQQRGRGIGATVLTDAVADKQVGLGDPRTAPAYLAVYNFVAGNIYKPVASDIYLNNNFGGGYGSIEISSDFATATTIVAYREAELDYRSNSPGFLINQREKDHQFSVEARLAGNGTGFLQWLVGAYYFSEGIDVPQVSFNQQVAGSYQSYSANTKSMALFGRLTGKISDTFRITVGGRYTTEDKDFGGSLYSMNILCSGTALAPPGSPVTNCFGAPLLNTTILPAPIFAPNGALIPFQPFGTGAAFPGGPATTPSFLSASALNVQKSQSFERFTWRAGFEWDILDRSLLYGTFEKGFKSGGFFFSSDNPVYQPEKIDAWTLGMKNRFLDNRLQVNIEAFWWKYQDQQVSSVARDSAGNVIFATRNVGQSSNKGIEIETMALVTPTTQLSGTVQYLDAKYDSFVFATPNFSPQVPGLLTSIPPLANCPAVLGTPTTNYIQNCSGKTPPNAPKWVVSLGAQQTIPLGAWKLVLNANTRYQSRTITGLEYLASEVQEGFWQSDAAVTLADIDDKYFVTAFVNNIENNDTVGAAFPDPYGGAGLVSASMRPPRTFGVRAGLKF